MPDPISTRVRQWGSRTWQRFSTTVNPRVPGIGIQPASLPLSDGKATALLATREAFEAQVTAGAGPMLDRHSTYPATSLDPTKIETTMREADLGIVYRYADLDMQVRQRDAHLRSVDFARRTAVANKPFLVLPYDDTPLARALANYLRSVVDDIDGFQSSIFSILVANSTGYGCGELVWAEGARRFPDADGKPVSIRGLFPRNIPWIHGKHFRFQSDNRDQALIDLGANRLAELVPGKFLFHRCMGDGIASTRGYIRSVVWLHFLKHASLRDWGIFLHLYGIPQLYGSLDRQLWTDANNRSLLEAALVAYGTGESAPVLPEGMRIEVQQGPTPAAVQAHQTLCGYCDASMSKAVQGETLTTELGGVGGYNAGEIHAQSKHDVILGDAVTMAADIRSDLFRSAVEINIAALSSALNASPDDIRSVIARAGFETDRETSPRSRMEILTGYAKAGVKISVSQIREENNLRPPSSEADVLPGDAVTISKDGAVVGAAAATEGVKNPSPDAVVSTESSASDAPATTAPTEDNAAPTASQEAPPQSEPVALPSESLNGAQVTALLDVLGKVASGEIPKASAAAVIGAAFPLSKERIAAMLDPIEVKPQAVPDGGGET